MNRRAYWNTKYVEYWKARTEEAERGTQSDMVKGDKATTNRGVYHALLDLLAISADDVVLELGCGFGRSFDYLTGQSRNVYGIDISTEMISYAQASYHTQVKGLVVAEAEHLPFTLESFTKIVCFAVFDTLDQIQTLIEMNMLLSPGGDVLITGKNDNYHDNDEMASIAEIKAREKGHPNYFTDVASLLKHLPVLGFIPLKINFYSKRGDLSANRHVTGWIDHFYEYCLILRKLNHVNLKQCAHITIASDKSKTFLRKLSHV